MLTRMHSSVRPPFLCMHVPTGHLTVGKVLEMSVLHVLQRPFISQSCVDGRNGLCVVAGETGAPCSSPNPLTGREKEWRKDGIVTADVAQEVVPGSATALGVGPSVPCGGACTVQAVVECLQERLL